MQMTNVRLYHIVIFNITQILLFNIYNIYHVPTFPIQCIILCSKDSDNTNFFACEAKKHKCGVR